MKGYLMVSITAEEIAVMYRRMASNQSSPRRAGLLRLVSDVLEDLALEALRGRVSEATLERLIALERVLRINGLPSERISRLISISRRLVVPEIGYYLPPQVEVSNIRLS